MGDGWAIDRHHLRLAHVEYTSLPADIGVEAMLGLAVVVFGVFASAGELKPVSIAAHYAAEAKPTAFHPRSSFVALNHRGRRVRD